MPHTVFCFFLFNHVYPISFTINIRTGLLFFFMYSMPQGSDLKKNKTRAYEPGTILNN